MKGPHSLSIMLIGTGILHADPLIYEPFDFPVGDLSTESGGAWSDSGTLIESPGITFGNLATAGNRVTMSDDTSWAEYIRRTTKTKTKQNTMKTTLKRSCIATLALAALAVTPAVAAVTIAGNGFLQLSGDTGLVNEGSGVYSYTFNSTALAGFSASGTDNLVVGIMNKATGSNAGPLVSSVTYNSSGLSEAVQSANSFVRNSVFYLDGGSSDGDLVIKFSDGDGTTPSNQTAYIIGLYALNGTASGFADSASAGSAGASVDVSTSSGFALNLWSRNNGDHALVTPSDFTADIDTNVGVSGGNLEGLFASSITTSAGSYVAGVSGKNQTTAMVGVAFDAIPEPSTALLGGLGLLALLRRRRA